MDSQTVKKIIDAKEADLQVRWDKMDEDARLLNMSAYQLMGFDNRAMTNVVNVTLNTPGTTAENMIDDLKAAVFQWQVIGQKGLSETTKKTVKSFIDNALQQIDEQLVNSGKATLHDWLSTHVITRSLIGVRILVQVKDGKLQIKCLPVDMRFTTFEFGEELSWVCAKFNRTKEQIKKEYPDITVKEGTSIEVKDWWDGEENHVFIDGVAARQRKHSKGSPPFVIVLPTSGWMYQDQEYIVKDAWESILFLNRELYAEQNRLASIASTKAMESIRPGVIQNAQNPEGEADAPPKQGQVLKMGLNEKMEPIKNPDIPQAYERSRQDIDTAIKQGGSINNVDAGNVLPQDMSAIMLTTQEAIRAKFRRPRLNALSVFYQQFAKKIIQQVKASSEDTEEFEIGSTGLSRTFPAVNLGDPDTYQIQVRLMTHNKSLEIANASVAASLWGKLPDSWIIENIMLAEDPEEVMDKLRIQRARQADPALELIEMAMSYIDEAANLTDTEKDLKLIESMRLTDMACMQIRNSRMPQPLEQSGKGNNTNALAAMAARGGQVL